jgi:hypothetical protein
MADETDKQLTDYDRKLIEAFHAYQVHGSEIKAAREIGVARHTFSNRLLRYFLRGLDGKLPIQPLPGHIVKSQSATYDADGNLITQSLKTGFAPSEEAFEVPDGHRVKGESALIDANGNVIQKWVKTGTGGRSPEDIAEAARIAAETYAPAPNYERGVVRKKVGLEADLLNLYPLADLHLGAHLNGATAEETWNLEYAVKVVLAMFEDLILRSPAAHTAAILGGGDMLHADDDLRETRQSGNRLEVAEPYAVILGSAEAMAVRMVELALLKYEKVIVRFLPGNHDPDSAIAIGHYLKAWFRLDDRVEVDIDPGLFWFHRWGQVMLGATHGHAAKINEMPGIMAADQRRMWGQTEIAYAHGFHIHHKTKSAGEEGGCSWETHQTPAPRDTYHQGKNYRSGRSMCAITYSKDSGEEERTTATVRRVQRSFA